MDERMSLVVVGAHLRGQPLNHELTQRGAVFERACRTAAVYRLFALQGAIRKPGLVRVTQGGLAFEVEVWSLPQAMFGGFVAGVPSPLCIGSVALEDGSTELGFLCENYAVATAEDISSFPGWVAYLRG